MKVLWKIALLVIIVLIVFYYIDDRVLENELLESPVNHDEALPVPEQKEDIPINVLERPAEGLSVWIGKTSQELLARFGEPNRKEPSAYGFDWWIYSDEPSFMAGISKGKVVQVYSASDEADMEPFVIGQNVEEIYRSTILESEINVKVEDSVYTFTLNSEDMKNRLLIPYEGMYAQLYIDGVDGQLEGVRFINPVMLVVQQPYDMAYMGSMVDVERPSSTVQMEVNRSIEKQLFELTNTYRAKHGLPEVSYDMQLDIVASEHSKDMAIENYFSHDSPKTGNLANRLKGAEITQKKAGENIAYNYVDAIEAVHGWANSPAHRNVLFDKDFTHIGTGAYGKYYTQDMIQKNEKDTQNE